MQRTIEQLSPEKREDERIGLKRKISEAVFCGNIDKIITVLNEVDKSLIERHSKWQDNQMADQRDTIEKLLFDLVNSDNKKGNAYIYLSDGGTSRLVIDVRDGQINIFPSDASTQQVKALWQEFQ
ncbi:MAG: hypothetical protein US30_C0023G0009 [Candidatus Moranbacteria bacterium GW2011_GWF2_36_839]|nr:MAG: hypothetical protein US27_C0023G0004 [Candidatus Moranbacteria bacterium GW2011_GWF1_36_78]KKQ16057.1 MAG: hypothetical protein US30_C0023G0009 [Candidatus Moranbacteria bacterium GW2011_GWF2_36_839]HAT74365.1 hypothetical protein [Candidatus Moranbacteria bacterium]HBY11245.1 hypothetical protein [Candidatus Moranbacteria bacterium]